MNTSMPNRQLVDYVREQLSHGMDLAQLRSVLLSEGWSAEDVETAINAAYKNTSRSTHKQHHTNFVAVSILAIVVLILGVSVFMIVFNNPEPTVPPGPNPPPVTPPNHMTGWAVCADIDKSSDKHSCYVTENEKEIIDCMAIDDAIEQQFCFRGQEEVLLARYNS